MRDWCAAAVGTPRTMPRARRGRALSRRPRSRWGRSSVLPTAFCDFSFDFSSPCRKRFFLREPLASPLARRTVSHFTDPRRASTHRRSRANALRADILASPRVSLLASRHMLQARRRHLEGLRTRTEKEMISHPISISITAPFTHKHAIKTCQWFLTFPANEIKYTFQ